MRRYFRNLLAAIRGRRAQGQVQGVVDSFLSAAETLQQASVQLRGELQTTSLQIVELEDREQDIKTELLRSSRLQQRLVEFAR